MANDVVTDRHIVNGAARAHAGLVLGVKQDRSPALRLGPVVFKNVALNQLATRILRLVQILGCELSSEEARILNTNR
jgi:hypothetical protein